MGILDKTIELYERYNSTCIIDAGTLIIESPDFEALQFGSDLEMIDFLLTEMILAGDI